MGIVGVSINVVATEDCMPDLACVVGLVVCPVAASIITTMKSVGKSFRPTTRTEVDPCSMVRSPVGVPFVIHTHAQGKYYTHPHTVNASASPSL
jgi:hypothetical protein